MYRSCVLFLMNSCFDVNPFAPSNRHMQLSSAYRKHENSDHLSIKVRNFLHVVDIGVGEVGTAVCV